MDPRRRSTTSGAVRGMGCAMRPDYPSVCFDYDFINNKTRGNKGGGIKRLCHAVIPFGKHQTEEPIAPNLSQTPDWMPITPKTGPYSTPEHRRTSLSMPDRLVCSLI